MNDSEFVQGLRRGDPTAVKHLTECYLPSVWRGVYVRVDGDRHLAEDIVSEAVLALVRAVAADTEIENPVAWLRSVALHKIQDHYRAVARVQHLIQRVRPSGDATDDDAATQHERMERRETIRRTMDRLPERQRIVLEWKYIEKLTVREIARRLSTTEKAVESTLFRARREFREILQRTDEAEDHDPGPCVCRSQSSPDPPRATAGETLKPKPLASPNQQSG